MIAKFAITAEGGLNSNIRCIEINLTLQIWENSKLLNSNIRCIEIFIKSPLRAATHR